MFSTVSIATEKVKKTNLVSGLYHGTDVQYIVYQSH